MVIDIIYDARYVVSLLLSIKDFGHRVRVVVSSFEVRSQQFATGNCITYSMLANGIAFLLQGQFRSRCVVYDRHIVC